MTGLATVSSAEAAARPAKPKIRLSDLDRRFFAHYDAAQTTDDNVNHWALADHLSARAAHNPAVRRVLRIRSRYEVANSPLARNILTRLADYVVGTGPRLQVKTKNRDYNRAVERAFSRWCIAVGFAHKLWQMRFSQAVNGEAIAVFFTNRAARNAVKLDLRTVEADQLADPTFTTETQSGSDGIVFDDFGNPLAYRILRRHPGDTFALPTLPDDYETLRADDVIHLFRPERPGQVRGVPQITASLPLFAMRRRYILAVLSAAETAANIAAVLKTQGSTADPDEVEPLDVIDLVRNAILTLPKGHELDQLKSEQPTTTIEMFDGVITREIARCVSMPFGIAAADLSRYNFASGKLDMTPWWQTVRIDQDRLEDVAVDPTFERWHAEAKRIPGLLPPPPADAIDGPPHQWVWDGQELLDPRESGSKETGLKGGFEFHGRIAARRGEDVLEEWEAQADLLGITLDEYRQLVRANLFGAPTAAGSTPAGDDTVDRDTGEPAEDDE